MATQRLKNNNAGPINCENIWKISKSGQDTSASVTCLSNMI